MKIINTNLLTQNMHTPFSKKKLSIKKSYLYTTL